MFNGEKCEVKKDSVTFFRTVSDANGAHPDPKKVDAIHKIPPLVNQLQLQHFLGICSVSLTFHPITLYTHHTTMKNAEKDTEFMWNPTYQEAFNQIKKLVYKDTTLHYFDVWKPVTIQKCEMLACVFGAEKIHAYVFGHAFTIESDHKPLEQINLKTLADTPAQLQQMLFRL